MVCQRCVMVVRAEAEKLGLAPLQVTLGEITLKDEPSADKLKQFDHHLEALGFERIDDRRARLIEQIKKVIIETVRGGNLKDRKFNFSSLLADAMHYDYNYLSNLFSSVEGITLEQFIIRQKIERTKELLIYDELNLSQIAMELGYSSVAHLSAQFKKVTGFTPSELKKSHDRNQLRKPLDNIQDAAR